MIGPRIGELFAGYGGLGMGVQQVYGGEVAWVSEFDKGPSKILAHRFPGVPNHGDITKIDWSTVEPVDILTGGSPCQDLSHAGRRAGMTEGTRSNLWVAMREAIAQLRPPMVVWENVGGALSAAADCEVEPCPGCVGDGPATHLRALGRVLGDLASLGYDASWHSLRAADVGAPHGRLRVFVVATDAERSGRGAAWGAAPGQAAVGRAPAVAGGSGSSSSGLKLLPTALARDHKDHTIRREPHRPDDTDTLARALTDVPCALLPTPAVNDMGASYTPEEWDAWTDRMKAEHGNGNGHGKSSLHVEAARLLPTPRALDESGVRGVTPNRSAEANHRAGETLSDITHDGRWGQYAAAIHRWESLTRPAPAPTEVGPKGSPRLSARFSEWMMGLPDGWVTDVPGITRNEALKALGNGVVSQQAAEALWVMASWAVAA